MIGEDLLVDLGAHHHWRITQTSWWEPKTGMGWMELVFTSPTLLKQHTM